MAASDGVAVATQPADRILERRWSGLLVPLAIYAVARALSAIAFLWAAPSQIATDALRTDAGRRFYFVYAATAADPSYGELMTNWDGQWYQYIATEGYIPGSQSVTPQSGWAWAFPPGYPMLVGGLMRLTGLPFTVVGPTLSLVLGAAAMVVLYTLLRRSGGSFLAVTGVATTAFFVSAPLFQAAYSESLAFLLLASVLLSAARGRWWLASALTVALALVRLVTPPLAVIALVVLARRFKDGQRSIRDLAGPVVWGLTAAAGPFIWPTVSRRLLGSGSVEGTGRAERSLSGFGFGWFSSFAALSPWLVIPLVVIVVLLVRIMTDPTKRFWGVEVRTWGWTYPLFVMLVTSAMSGFIRYLLLAFPLGLPLAGGHEAPPRRRVVLLVVACVGLQLLQVLWIRYVWVVEYGDSLVP
jgi:hypothetical protein